MSDEDNGGADELRARVEALIQRVLGAGWTVTEVRRLSGGASQETYRVEATHGTTDRLFAFRRAAGGAERNPSSPHPGLEVEARLFSAAREAGVPVPEVVAVCEPTDGLGPGFLMEWLDGETLGPRIVRSPEFEPVRPRLARQCGEILGHIHAIDPRESGLHEVLRTTQPEQFVRDTWENYRRISTNADGEFAYAQPMIDYTALWLLDHLPDAGPPRLVHNDFRNGNLMIDPERGVIAVLDWEIAHLGDPVRDLGWICCNSWRFGGLLAVGGFGTRDELFDGYEAATGTRPDPDHVHFWEVFGSFWWAVGTLGMAHQYRVGPDRTVERPAIGRRTSECQMDCVNLLFPGEHGAEVPEPHAIELADRIDLLTSVRDFLTADVMRSTSGRTAFLARVAANSLDIVRRELAAGAAPRQRESASLEALGCPAPAATDAAGADAEQSRLLAQRLELVDSMESGTRSLDDPQLQEHLRRTVAQHLAIDQPRYTALRPAN